MKKIIVWVTLTIITIMCIYILFIMAALPSTYNGIGNLIVKDTVKKTGAINTVTAVVFDFRGYDTLGEAFVLFTAVTGVACILRKSKKENNYHE